MPRAVPSSFFYEARGLCPLHRFPFAGSLGQLGKGLARLLRWVGVCCTPGQRQLAARLAFRCCLEIAANEWTRVRRQKYGKDNVIMSDIVRPPKEVFNEGELVASLSAWPPADATYVHYEVNVDVWFYESECTSNTGHVVIRTNDPLTYESIEAVNKLVVELNRPVCSSRKREWHVCLL